MSDERDPRTEAKIRDASHSGHDVGERGPSREQRQPNVPTPDRTDEDSTTVTRAPRESSTPDNDDTTVSKRVLRRSDGQSPTRTSSGNESETGATATPNDRGGNRTAPSLPGKPMGCTSTAGVLMLSISALGVAVTRIIRR